MTNKTITCIECPNGCQVCVTLNGNEILAVQGQLCPRGKKYAENECIAPRRVLTTTVKTTDGRVLPVKTAAPILKQNMFTVMQRINALTVTAPVGVGDVVSDNIDENISLVATGNIL